jgi:hypothetical protein
MISEKLHFTVNFNWLTDFVRSLWAEGSFRKALTILEDMGIPQHESFEIIRGNLKMLQNPKGEKGIDGITAKDNWKPNLPNCELQRYPDPEELASIERDRDKYAKIYINQCVSEIYAVLSELHSAIETGNGMLIGNAEEKLLTYPDEAFSIVGIDKNSYEEHTYKAELLHNAKIQKEIEVEEYVQHQLELDKKPLPAIDTTLESIYGWLLPTGDFYPCEWQDHIWLAGKLGKSEHQAEYEGWIKFTKSGIYYLAVDMPTQKQIDMIFEWCKKHDELKAWDKFKSTYLN